MHLTLPATPRFAVPGEPRCEVRLGRPAYYSGEILPIPGRLIYVTSDGWSGVAEDGARTVTGEPAVFEFPTQFVHVVR